VTLTILEWGLETQVFNASLLSFQLSPLFVGSSIDPMHNGIPYTFFVGNVQQVTWLAFPIAFVKHWHHPTKQLLELLASHQCEQSTESTKALQSI
jgi:hypothetical protein